MRRLRQFMLLAAFVTGLALMAVPSADAQTAPAPKAMDSECSKHVGVTNRVAGCIREQITNVSGRFFGVDRDKNGKPVAGFYPLVSKFIGGFMTLGVVIYGVMAAGGMVEKVGRDTLMLLVKLSMVAYFTLNADMMYRMVIDGMDSLGTVMVQVTPKYGMADGHKDFANVQCFKRLTAGTLGPDGKMPVGPWLAMDCLIDTVYGIKMQPRINAGGMSTNTGAAANEWFNGQIEGQGLQRGLIFFFFSGMKTSVLGMMLGVLGFIFMWGVLAMIIKALLTYVSGYIGVTFLMIVSPLFIPLALFRDTKHYFDKWVKLVISFALQPVLILLFISLSIAAVDLALFSGDYSVMYRIAGEASRDPGFSLNKYLTDKQAVTSQAVTPLWATANTQLRSTQQTEGNAVVPGFTGACTGQDLSAGGAGNPECAENLAIQAYRDTIDWAKLAEARVPKVVLTDGAERLEQQISREVMAAVILCGVVIFVMNRLMAIVPHILVDLIGDFGQTPNLYGNATGGWDKASEAMSGQASGMMQGALSSLSTRRGGT